jgi:hypothetical protein
MRKDTTTLDLIHLFSFPQSFLIQPPSQNVVKKTSQANSMMFGFSPRQVLGDWRWRQTARGHPGDGQMGPDGRGRKRHRRSRRTSPTIARGGATLKHDLGTRGWHQALPGCDGRDTGGSGFVL